MFWGYFCQIRIGWQVRDLYRKYFFSRDVIFNRSVPGHLSPHHSVSINFASLPPPSTVPDTEPNTFLPIMSIHQLHLSSTPLYQPTISDTIHDHNVFINTQAQRTTRTTTNSLPNPKHLLGSGSRMVDSGLRRWIPKGLGLSLCAVPS
jgi:hypothetical protein